MCLRSVCPKGGKENQTRCGGRYSYGDFGHTDHYLDPVSNMSSLILDQHLDTFVKHFVPFLKKFVKVRVGTWQQCKQILNLGWSRKRQGGQGHSTDRDNAYIH